jgi:predicted XRE-type DNA-binding protein
LARDGFAAEFVGCHQAIVARLSRGEMRRETVEALINHLEERDMPPVRYRLMARGQGRDRGRQAARG